LQRNKFKLKSDDKDKTEEREGSIDEDGEINPRTSDDNISTCQG
jgi:hypothetical protein